MWRNPTRVGIWLHSVFASFCRRNGFQHRWCKDFAYWEGVWPYLDPWDVVRLRTSSSFGNVPRKHGLHGELFFFLIKNEPFALPEAVQCNPIQAVSQFPDLGDVWRQGCPKNPDWHSDGESWSDSERLSSSDFREHNVESPALRVYRAKLRTGNLRGGGLEL